MNGDAIAAERVLYATGRLPNTGGLGLEKVGVALDAMGAVKVDGFSRTSVPTIYAVGDVTDRVNLTPVAIREGHAFADTRVRRQAGRRSIIADIPTAVFSTPEIGTVGLTEEEARGAAHAVDIFQTSFRPMKATLSGREERTLMKLVVDGADRPGARRATSWATRRAR